MPPKRGAKKGKAPKKGKAKVEEPVVEDQDVEMPMETDEPPAESGSSVVQATSDVIAKAETAVSEAAVSVKETVHNVAEAAGEFVEEMTMTGVEAPSQSENTPTNDGVKEAEGEKEVQQLTMEERKAKFNELRKKMAASTKANRTSLVEESAKAKVTARDAARLDRQRKLAEMLRTKADAEERGEDVERQKNWDYTIEENDEWEKKLARKKRRADFAFHDDSHAARRKYKKDLDFIKPDLEAYNKQKALTMSQGGSSLSTFSSVAGSSELTAASEDQRMASESLYRDANTLIYGDSKPSEDAIDRVVSKMNNDIDKKSKFSRKRPNDDEGDITYINEHNRVFNKKIARYYDKYTAEIRASFERGTAL